MKIDYDRHKIEAKRLRIDYLASRATVYGNLVRRAVRWMMVWIRSGHIGRRLAQIPRTREHDRVRG